MHESFSTWLGARQRTELLCSLAIFLLPWQARYIFLYREVTGQPYEYGTISLYAGSIIVLAAVFSLWRERRVPVRGLFLSWVFFVWLFLASLYAVDVPLAFATAATSLIAFGYLLIANALPWQKLSIAIIAAGMLQSVIAWVQFIIQHVSANTFLGVAEHSPFVLGQSVVMIYGHRVLRAYGLLPHPNMLGGFTAIALLILLIRFRAFRLRPPEMQTRKRWIGYVAGILLMFSVELITFSRSALIGFAAGLVLWAVVSILLKKKKELRGLGEAAFLMIALLLVFNLVAGNAWFSRFGIRNGEPTEEQRLEQVSFQERVRTYYESGALLNIRTIFIGTGPGNYVARLAKAFTGLPSYAYQPVHNSYVMVLLESGMVGVLFLGMALWQLTRRALRELSGARLSAFSLGMLQSGVVILLIIAVFDHYLWTSYFGQSLFWLTLGSALRIRGWRVADARYGVSM